MTDNIKLPPLPEWTKRDDLDGLLPSEVRVAVREERDALAKDAARYAIARRMSPRQWADAWELNHRTGKPFDEIIDDLAPFFDAAVAPQAQSSTEAWRDLAIAGAAIVEEIREIVGLKGKPGDVVKAVRELAAALEAAQMGLRYAVRVWVLSDEIVWSEEKIDEVVESIIGDAKKEAGND